MAKTPAITYTCSECGWTTHKWVGRCAQCGEWGSLDEECAGRTPQALAPSSPAQPITSVSAEASVKQPTGVSELDRVLGGGLVALQAMAVSTGLPFTIVLLVGCISIVKGLMSEPR